MKQLSTKTKIFYGMGAASRGIKDGLFQLFLFFYFSQVLGLDAALAGTSSLIALVFDAITDPLVGLLSDRWESKKWGRRHPFIIASALPLGLSTWLLFMPPEGLGAAGLFWWMTGFTILVRTALTFFIVPHASLGAELSTDYKERTSITSTRILFASFISPVLMIVGYLFFFVPTQTIENGLLNAAAYPKFALLSGVLMVFFILISAFGTRQVIPELPLPSAEQRSQNLTSQFSMLGRAFRMPSFRSLILFVMFIYIAIGIGVIFSPYLGPYFFGFSAQQMAALPIGAAIGAILALMIAPNLGEWLDKKWAAFYSTLIFGLFFTLPFSLSLLGLFPEPGSTLLLPLYVFTLIIAYLFLWVALSLANSMMADVVDAFELESGNRQEGLFFASLSFAFKCTSGLGSFLAGLLLTWISFPKQAQLSELSIEAIQGLGLVGGPILLFFYLLSSVFILPYPLTKQRYQEIRKSLENEVSGQ